MGVRVGQPSPPFQCYIGKGTQRLSDYRVEDAATAGKDEATMKKPLIPFDFFYSTHFCRL